MYVQAYRFTEADYFVMGEFIFIMYAVWKTVTSDKCTRETDTQ